MMREIIEDKDEWFKQAVIYGKTIVDLAIGDDLYLEGKRKRKWNGDETGDRWFLTGSPVRGYVVLSKVPMVVSCGALVNVVVSADESIVEFNYPENPEIKYNKWYDKNHKYFSKKWLNFETFLLRGQ